MHGEVWLPTDLYNFSWNGFYFEIMIALTDHEISMVFILKADNHDTSTLLIELMYSKLHACTWTAPRNSVRSHLTRRTSSATVCYAACRIIVHVHCILNS